MNKDPYHLFYDFYNTHYDHDLKSLFLDLIHKYIHKKGPLLECGCGPAHISIALRKQGFDITASDISDDFLFLAKKNAQKEAVTLNTLRHDILKPFPQTYHAIIMVFDVINHLETLNDFHRAILDVYDALEDGGVFIFDSLRCEYIESMIHYHETLTSQNDTLDWMVSKGPYPCSFRHRLKREDVVSTLNQRSFDLKTLKSLISKFTILDEMILEERIIFVLKK